MLRLWLRRVLEEDELPEMLEGIGLKGIFLIGLTIEMLFK